MTAEGSANPASDTATTTTPLPRTAETDYTSRFHDFLARWLLHGRRRSGALLGNTDPTRKQGVIISGVPPFLLKTPDIRKVSTKAFSRESRNRYCGPLRVLHEFFKNFYNMISLNKRVTDRPVQASWNVAAACSANASLACVQLGMKISERTEQIDVPALVMHGDADRILPINAAGLRTAKLIKGARLVVVKDGPHCITWTHADEVNAELLSFLGKLRPGTQSKHVRAKHIEGERPVPRAAL